MFKKVISIACILLLVVSLCSCGGKVSEAKITPVDSEIYSKEDIDSAINVTIDYFKSNFHGCSLKEIHYAGDDYSDEFYHWKKQYNADEAIVLLSSFYVDSSGGDGSLNPNETYENWNWILVRNKGGNWEHKDHGY